MVFKSTIAILAILLSVEAFGKLPSKTPSNNPFAKSNDPMMSAQGPSQKTINLNGATNELSFGKLPVKQVVAALNDPAKSEQNSQARFDMTNPRGPSIYAQPSEFLAPAGLGSSDQGTEAEQ